MTMDLPSAYIDDEEAEEIAARVVDSAAWSSATAGRRAAALVQASDEIDTLRFEGRKLDPDQLRAFPRYVEADPPTWPDAVASQVGDNRADQTYGQVWALDSLGNPVAPDAVKVATFLQALFILANPERMARLEAQAAGLAAQSAGGFSESYKPGTGAAMHLVCLQARKVLGPYLLTGGRPV